MEHLKRDLKKSSNWYYRRRTPTDVLALPEAKGEPKVYEKSLGTADKREAKRRALVEDTKLEARWAMLRGEASELERWRADLEWLGVTPPLDLTTENDADAAAAEMDALRDGLTKPPQGVTEATYVSWLTASQTQPQRPSVPIREAFKAWLKERKPSPSNQRGAERVVDQFDALVDGLPLDQITRQHARNYRDAVLASGASPGTAQTYLSYLRTVFQFALTEELIDQRTNPFAGLAVPKTKAPEEERTPIPRDAALSILDTSLRGAPDDQADYFAAVLLLTGMRPLEAYKAKRKKTDGGIEVFEVPRVKTSPPRIIPVHPLLQTIEPLRFTVRPEQLRRQFITRWKPYVGYQCRHTFNDEAIRIEMPLETRLRLMGHAWKGVAGVNSRYGSATLDPQAALEWVEKMWRK